MKAFTREVTKLVSQVLSTILAGQGTRLPTLAPGNHVRACACARLCVRAPVRARASRMRRARIVPPLPSSRHCKEARSVTRSRVLQQCLLGGQRDVTSDLHVCERNPK
ncbi:unnamed protein product [Mesocestoides corti]|uniref:Secreted protein n=1 Tax=Mesocestoides corti TaxID=53468 RepID=A0A0R3UI82_MESCO|nr:unnamed protein product [Mesocestoides corti]